MKTDFTNPSQSYMTPEIEVTEIIAEGVLCSSIAAPDWSYDEEIIY